MDKKIKKLRVNKETIKALTNEHFKVMAGGQLIDTEASTCTQINCGWTYRNCPSSPQACPP